MHIFLLLTRAHAKKLSIKRREASEKMISGLSSITLLFILVSKQLGGGGEKEGKGSKIKNGSKINFFSLIVCNFCAWSNGSDRILPRPIRVFTFSGYKNVTERESERERE